MEKVKKKIIFSLLQGMKFHVSYFAHNQQQDFHA